MTSLSHASAPSAPTVKPGATVIFEDNALLDLTAAQGDYKQLSSQKLSNTWGVPIAVHELRFFVQTWPVKTIVTQTEFSEYWFDFGSIIKALISTNNIKLTQNYTHLRAFGSFNQSQLSYAFDAYNIFGVLPSSMLVYNSTFFSWKLKKPLLIPRNGSFDISIGADAIVDRPLDYSATIPQVRVSVAVVGTLQPEIQNPIVTPYPFIAEFAPGGICADAAQNKPMFAMGNDPVFRNIFAAPLHLHRFSAALYSNEKNVSASDNQAYTDVVTVYPSAVTAKLADSRGNNIAGYGGYGGSATGSSMAFNGMPLGAFVNPEDEDWTVDRILDAYQWINCELYANLTGAFDTEPIWFPRVAYEGSHDELMIP